jgi:hypothetical protein
MFRQCRRLVAARKSSRRRLDPPTTIATLSQSEWATVSLFCHSTLLMSLMSMTKTTTTSPPPSPPNSTSLRRSFVFRFGVCSSRFPCHFQQLAHIRFAICILAHLLHMQNSTARCSLVVARSSDGASKRQRAAANAKIQRLGGHQRNAVARQRTLQRADKCRRRLVAVETLGGEHEIKRRLQHIVTQRQFSPIATDKLSTLYDDTSGGTIVEGATIERQRAHGDISQHQRTAILKHDLGSICPCETPNARQTMSATKLQHTSIRHGGRVGGEIFDQVHSTLPQLLTGRLIDRTVDAR